METINSIQLKRIFAEIARVLNENKDLLTELDSVMGDGDLGLYVPKGFKCAAEALTDDMLPGQMFMKASSVVNSEAPSTLGTLLSFALLAAGKTAGSDSELSGDKIVEIGQSAIDMIMKRGKAQPGEKTILDVFIPAHEELKGALAKNPDLRVAFEAALNQAKAGFDRSTEMQAVHGRPGYYGEASIGKQDGGAMVGYLIYQGILQAFL